MLGQWKQVVASAGSHAVAVGGGGGGVVPGKKQGGGDGGGVVAVHIAAEEVPVRIGLSDARTEPTVVSAKPFRFYSGAKECSDSTCKFSNFFAAEVEVGRLVFPSSEHAYQAMGKFPESEWHRFAVGGDLAGFGGLSSFYPQHANKRKDTAQGKADFWSKKQMVGVLWPSCVRTARAKPGCLRPRTHSTCLPSAISSCAFCEASSKLRS